MIRLFSVLLIILFAFLFILASWSRKTPNNLGLRDDRLSDCPTKDNCVCTQASIERYRVETIPSNDSLDVVMMDLSNLIESMSGGKVIEINDNYVRAEFTTRIFRFVDDLECFYDKEYGVIHLRSASRVGYFDLNTNRNRVEELRIKFLAKRK
ncbi:DUF1499 domain-containing protein [Pseudodesulfovibrio sp. zrk46]|nr:DUF1499 domain-containing protein [Pseudodesulfovibrio sp. zrk46]